MNIFQDKQQNPDSQKHYIHSAYYLIKNDEACKEARNYNTSPINLLIEIVKMKMIVPRDKIFKRAFINKDLKENMSIRLKETEDIKKKMERRRWKLPYMKFLRITRWV